MIRNKKESGDIQQEYKELIPQKRFFELSRLMESSNIPPADFIVRMGFKSYVEEKQNKRVKLFYIMKLKEITGVIPENSVLKTACETALELDNPEILESLANRLEIDKTLFKDLSSTLQKMYSTYVDEGRFVDISKLMEITALNPREETIHNGYKSYLLECKFISFSGLKKRTGIVPDEQMVQDMYQKYQSQYFHFKTKRHEEEAEEWFNRIKKLERISKIKPKNLNIKEPEENPEE